MGIILGLIWVTLELTGFIELLGYHWGSWGHQWGSLITYIKSYYGFIGESLEYHCGIIEVSLEYHWRIIGVSLEYRGIVGVYFGIIEDY